MIAAIERARFGAGMLLRLAAARHFPPAPWQPTIDRERAFLERLDALVALPGHPVPSLLRIAGWPLPRLRAELPVRGLEGTLRALADDGALLEADEVKCRRPIVRRGQRIPFSPPDLDGARGPAVPLGTSGTSGPRTKNPMDLQGFVLLASYKSAMLRALGASELPRVLYYPAPSAAGIAYLLAFALAGRPVDAWFCHLPESASDALPWSGRLRALARVAAVLGVRLAMPQVAEVERPQTLVDWLRRHAGGGAVLATFAGSALRLQAYADANALALPPLVFIVGGEPITVRKRALLEARGHRVYPWYGAVDAGRIAIGCLAPAHADDMHLLSDRYAAIEWQGRLLLTSLSPAAHKRYVNTDCGDLARVERRDCGCPIGALGLPFHVHDVRSLQKICLEGITLPADVVHSLADEMLPGRFGGSPADYQLVEEEGADGWTRLVVRVAPEIDADERAVVAQVYQVLREACPGTAAQALRIEQANGVTVRRERPRFSGGGKLLAAQPAPSHVRAAARDAR
jgi:hypothetical protein